MRTGDRTKLDTSCYFTSNDTMGSARNDNIPDLYDAGLIELQNGLKAGRFNSVQLVKVGS
jgi:hypothetical protein